MLSQLAKTGYGANSVSTQLACCTSKQCINQPRLLNYRAQKAVQVPHTLWCTYLTFK